MESELPVLKEKNPQLEVVTELSRGQHPYLKGIYSMNLSPLIIHYYRQCNLPITVVDISNSTYK